MTPPAADEGVDAKVQKAVKKKQDDVAKRLHTLQAKLQPDQLAELRQAQHTYTLVRSNDGLGMTITPECDIEAVRPGSLAAVRCPGPKTEALHRCFLKYACECAADGWSTRKVSHQVDQWHDRDRPRQHSSASATRAHRGTTQFPAGAIWWLRSQPATW